MVLETFSFCFFGPPFILEEVDMTKQRKKRIHWEDKKTPAFSIRAPTRPKCMGTSPSEYVPGVPQRSLPHFRFFGRLF